MRIPITYLLQLVLCQGYPIGPLSPVQGTVGGELTGDVDAYSVGLYPSNHS
jgi:hypothetical protein